MTVETAVNHPGADALHTWFGLSYANYLTIPRSILQSMPDEWQGRMTEMLVELNDTLDQQGISWPSRNLGVRVELVDAETETDYEPAITDPLSDYQRGRRRLW